MAPHEVSTKVPVDSRIGEEMVIFRSARRPHEHDNVLRGQRVEIVEMRGGEKVLLAAGTATAKTSICALRNVSERDVLAGYYAKARTRESLLACLKEMYADIGYDEGTPTATIRVLREE
jgi:hypothetical protein